MYAVVYGAAAIKFTEEKMIIRERIPDPQKRLDDCFGISVKPFDWRAYNNSQMREKIIN